MTRQAPPCGHFILSVLALLPNQQIACLDLVPLPSDTGVRNADGGQEFGTGFSTEEAV